MESKINNKKTLTTLKKMDTAYKNFVDSPTAKNLELFIQLSNQYTENWIEDASIDSNSKVSSKDLESEDFQELNHKKDSTISTIKETKPINIGKFLQRNEIGRVKCGMDRDHLVTRSTYCPPLKELNNTDLFYIDHSFKSTRYNVDKDKFFNRRWYVESDSYDAQGETGPKLPWELLRNEFNVMAEEANLQGLFLDQLDDDRIATDRVIFSGELDLEERRKYFNEITLPEERDYFMDRDVDFVIYETAYPKKPAQYITSDPANNIYTEIGVGTTLKNPPLWRDVCIFNPDLITFRSLTNDKTFKPKILIPDSINWVMSNDMPYISNQAIKTFLKYTHPKMKISSDEEDLQTAENPKIKFDVDLEFRNGEKYSRSDVHYFYHNEALPRIGSGRWTTGYVVPKGSDDLVIFMNIGVAGTTGHDFDNSFDEVNKVVTWYGQNKAHSKQPTFNKLIKGQLTPRLFARTNNRDEFTYLGAGSVKEYKDDVKIKEGSSIRIKFACEDNKTSLNDN